MDTIISIDAHKDTCTYIQKQGSQTIGEPTRIPSTKPALTHLAETHPNALYLLEASGSHEWIHDHLTQHDCTVFVGHPITREHSDRKKSDQADAARYAARYQVGDVKQVHVADPNTRKIRDLVRQRKFLQDEKTRLTNRLTSTLTRWGYHAEDNPDPFSDDGRTHVIANHPELAPLYELIDDLDEHIHALERNVKRHAREIPEAERLRSIPGIGALTALALHVEIQDINRFHNAEALVSYFGLDPVIKQSGNDRWHAHRISKQGRAYIRGLLNQAAWVHTNRAKASSLTATFKRLKERKGHQIAIVATARRLLKVAYHVLDKDRDFEMTPPTDH